MILKAKKLLINCCYGYYKRDTEEVATEAEEIERETRSYKCVYYVQYAGGKYCKQYYRYYELMLAIVKLKFLQ